MNVAVKRSTFISLSILIMAYFYPHRVTIAKNILTPDFILGKGCKIVLDLASRQLTKLLRNVYEQDDQALTMSPASLNYLLNSFGNPRVNEGTPSICVPKPVCYQPKILNELNGE